MARSLLIVVCVLVVWMTTASQAIAETPRTALIEALIHVESKGNDRAHGDKHLPDHAYGCLQIRQPCVDDVNSRYGTNYRAQDCFGNRELSLWIFHRYMDIYATESRIGRKVTYQDMSRIWNGGPSGCFDDGSIDKNGRKPKSAKARRKVSETQKRAKIEYWQKKVKPLL